MSDDSVILGPYAQGEIPEVVTYTFLRQDNTPEPLLPGTWTGKLEYRRWAQTAVTEKILTIADQTLNPGQVSWSWAAGDMTAYGDFEGELWVGNAGTNRLRSVKLRWVVRPTIVVPVV